MVQIVTGQAGHAKNWLCDTLVCFHGDYCVCRQTLCVCQNMRWLLWLWWWLCWWLWWWCHIHLPVCLWIMDPHRRAPKKKTNHGNEVLLQDSTHLIQRPCYQRGSLCQDPAGNWTTRRPPDDCKEMQTAVVWSYFLFIRSGQNHLAKHSERGKRWEDNIREWTGIEFGKSQRAVENREKWRKLVGKVICGAPKTCS